MISASSINFEGETLGKIKVPETLFGVEGKEVLVAKAVRVFLSNQRKAAAKTKTRAEVRKTTAKMYRQKGTGRARHGAYSAPIFVGGGIAHGPDGRQNFKKTLTKQNSHRALATVLSLKLNEGNIKIVAESEKFNGKTKEANVLVKKLVKDNEKMLFVATPKQIAYRRAFANISKVTVATPNQLNTYQVLRHHVLVFTNAGLEETLSLYSK